MFTTFPIEAANRWPGELLFRHAAASARSLASLLAFVVLVLPAPAQTNPPPVTCVRSFTNDIPNQPLVRVSLYGASNVTCVSFEEDLPPGATAQNVSGDGVWLPALNVIRWGPYTNTTSLSLSYHLAGLPGSYPVNGGSWMDGQWYFSPGVTIIPVLAPSGGLFPTPPQQLPSPIFVPPSGSEVPVNVFIGFPGEDCTLLDDTWATAIRTNQNLPQQSAWFVSGSSTNMTASVNALNFLIGTNAGLVGITYFTLLC